ncbi:RES family NAD+ phosphorylase [Erythrobacter sp. W302b]|uniref:RES family NAD+ phosphorylase n=1 Tax=Erythrobacter sp. W302b TaxID=3389874 RepID=UPI00396B171F
MASIHDGSSWVHDPELVEKLAEFDPEPFNGQVWRATGYSRDPMAFSYNGGRWAPPSSITSNPVLYTSFDKEGAIHEMASWMALLTPPPSKPIKVHSLSVAARSVVALSLPNLASLGVDVQNYERRNYAAMDEFPPSKSQEIGAALSFLGVDGLIVPSARFACNNLILFDNQNNQIEIDVDDAEIVNWMDYI